MKHHAFLSFANQDLHAVDQFRGEMEDRYPELSLVEHPVTQPFGNGFSAYIRGQIAQTIDTAPMTICLISERTASSPWVGWAIDQAHSKGKDILGVRLQSDATKDVPPAGLVTAGARIVDRDIDEVVALSSSRAWRELDALPSPATVHEPRSGRVGSQSRWIGRP